MHRIIRGHVRGAAERLRNRWDGAILAARRQLKLTGPALILPYRTFGTAERFRIAGRVVEDRGVVAASHTDSTPHNLWLTFKRYAAHEVNGARLSFRAGDESGPVVTNRRGFFEVEVKPTKPLSPASGDIWAPVELELVAAPGVESPHVAAEAFVLMPPPSARFGIISDVDDTIVKTGATDFLKHWRTIVANSAEARVAFRGLAPFYRALHAGVGGSDHNPIFYVSSSPWNLYDLFERFLVLHQIPLGPILLRHVGIREGKWPRGGHSTHKLARIANVLAAYPHLRFVLVGDSGQHDAEIYTEAARLHPGRIAAIYIRDVTEEARDLAAKGVLHPVSTQGIRIAYGADLMEAAEDAAAAGWIASAALPEIRAAIRDPDRPGA